MDVDAVVAEITVATETFVNGDPEPFKGMWSHADDVTIFGGYGSHEQGWEQVSRRLDWASARFGAGQVAYEPIASGSSGDLAYAVGIERGHAALAGQEEQRPMVLRVTHLLRREEGGWRVIHRHADAVADVLPPGGLPGDRT